MESSVYGHPGEPREGGALPALLQTITAANFGQTFEENGLRARLELSAPLGLSASPHPRTAHSPVLN